MQMINDNHTPNNANYAPKETTDDGRKWMQIINDNNKQITRIMCQKKRRMTEGNGCKSSTTTINK
jgi:hypothetical protein